MIFVIKLLTVKVSNYFPSLHEKSDNSKQGERYGIDRLKKYDFPQSDFHPFSPAKRRLTFHEKQDLPE